MMSLLVLKHSTVVTTSSRRPSADNQATQRPRSKQYSRLCSTVELTNVFTDIFIMSLQQKVVPTCLKIAIIPVPKKLTPFSFIDLLH